MNLFAPIVPLLVFLLLWGIFFKSQDDWRVSFLSAAISWGVLLVAMTELLSLFKAISFWPVFSAWCLCLLATILYGIRKIGMPKDFLPSFRWPDISRFELFLLGSMAFIACMVGLIAWIAPPNTWDSMTYHMARIMHWIQDASVTYYPTHILRQLFMNPGSEFIILHFQILSGGDRLANLVQWFSMVGSAIGVTLIARGLGADRRGQLFSAVVSMTIPMGILQGSSTQNDYVTAFWLVCFIYWMITLDSKGIYWSAFASGVSLGLALLTKATNYIYALPFLIWLSLSLLKTHRRNGIPLLSIIALCTVIINLGYYLRNDQLFSNIFGLMPENPRGTSAILSAIPNDIFSFPELTSNVMRNFAINLGTPFDAVNDVLDKTIYQLHDLIGISPNDPRTTWPATIFHVQQISFYEGNAGNLLHIVLITTALLLIIFSSRYKRYKIVYILPLIAAFLLYSLIVRWQPWQSRLILPLFILWAPIIGISTAGIQKRRYSNTMMVLLLAGCLPWVFLNETRPIIGFHNIFNSDRDQQYFASQPSIELSYPRTAYQLTNYQCKQIGLYLGENDWEYPLWILIYQEVGRDVRIENVSVENISAVRYDVIPQFMPCAVLVVNHNSLTELQDHRIDYHKVWSSKDVSILIPR